MISSSLAALCRNDWWQAYMRIDHTNRLADCFIFDKGANAPIRFCRWYDDTTWEYEAVRVASNGVDMACDERYRALIYHARAVGPIIQIPLGEAHRFGIEPKKVIDPVASLTHEAKQEGVEQYKRVYREVWHQRGESFRCVDQRWVDFLKTNTFLDHLCLRKQAHRDSIT